MKRVAVVILNWNGAALLRQYLPRVIQNTPAELATIVVADNASTDESRAVLRDQFSEVEIIELSENYGFAGGYNRAVARLQNEYVVLLNSDAAPHSGWLEPLLALMDSDEIIAVCGPKLIDDKNHSLFEYAGAAGGFIDRYGYPFCRGRFFDTVEADNSQYDNDLDCLWVSGAALMIRRSLYEAAGGLDEDFFAHMEEIDLCWRLRNMGKRIVLCSQSTVYHLGGATLDSANAHKTYLNFRNNLWLLVKNYNTRACGFVIFARMILDGMAAAKFLVGMKPKHFWAIARAHFAFYQSLPSLLRKRKRLLISRQKTLPPQVKPISIVWRYFACGKKTFDEVVRD